MMSQFCPICEAYCRTKAQTVTTRFHVRGMEIDVPITRQACAVCGENLSSDEQDQEILDAVNAEYRKKTDLLTPERIQNIRERYSLSQKSFALLLGMSEATINRYEKGALQDQSHDTAIRACEDPKFIRDLLDRRGALLTDWQRNRVLNALTGQDNRKSRLFVNTAAMMPDEVSERTGFRHFDYDRFCYTVIYLCKSMGEISTTVINKLLFYADFLNFKTATVSLTGTAYRRLDYGPVPADYDGLLSKMEAAGLVEKKEKVFSNECTGFYYKSGPAADSVSVELSGHETALLNFISKEFKGCTAKEISERSHREDAWRQTNDKELISYLKAQTLSLNLPS